MINIPALKTIDVAKLLDIDPVTVRKLVRSGKIKAYRYGKGYRFYESDVQTYITNSKITILQSKDIFED